MSGVTKSVTVSVTAVPVSAKQAPAGVPRVVGADIQTARVPTTMSLSTERPSERTEHPSGTGQPSGTNQPSRSNQPSGSNQPSSIHENLVDAGPDAAWSIISYILSGILFWGLTGWLLDRWLFDPSSDTPLFRAVGVLVGTAAGGYLGYMRFLQRTRQVQ